MQVKTALFASLLLVCVVGHGIDFEQAKLCPSMKLMCYQNASLWMKESLHV